MTDIKQLLDDNRRVFQNLLNPVHAKAVGRRKSNKAGHVPASDPEIRNRLIEGRRQGKTLKELSIESGFSSQYVWSLTRDFGPFPSKRGRPQGSRTKYQDGKPFRPVMEKRWAEARALREDGYTLAGAAEKLGLSFSYVRRLLKLYGDIENKREKMTSDSPIAQCALALRKLGYSFAEIHRALKPNNVPYPTEGKKLVMLAEGHDPLKGGQGFSNTPVSEYDLKVVCEMYGYDPNG